MTWGWNRAGAGGTSLKSNSPPKSYLPRDVASGWILHWLISQDRARLVFQAQLCSGLRIPTSHSSGCSTPASPAPVLVLPDNAGCVIADCYRAKVHRLIRRLVVVLNSNHTLLDDTSSHDGPPFPQRGKRRWRTHLQPIDPIQARGVLLVRDGGHWLEAEDGYDIVLNAIREGLPGMSRPLRSGLPALIGVFSARTKPASTGLSEQSDHGSLVCTTHRGDLMSRLCCTMFTAALAAALIGPGPGPGSRRQGRPCREGRRCPGESHPGLA